ncbi:MAG: transcription initiation protein [Gammaproteobacteria bacterium]|nr:transcription initiation protein [Gammaproteobacteria bacterium]
MQYLMIICHDDAFAPPETLFADIGAWITKMDGRGIREYGNPLRPASDSTTVRMRNGRLLRTCGPFTDSDEKICAYELIECRDLEEAVDVAAQHAMARVATIEVRPIWNELAV